MIYNSNSRISSVGAFPEGKKIIDFILNNPLNLHVMSAVIWQKGFNDIFDYFDIFCWNVVIMAWTKPVRSGVAVSRLENTIWAPSVELQPAKFLRKGL